MSVLIDLTGKRYGRLTVLRREGTYQRPSGNKEPTWRCVCDCGNEVVVTASNLKRETNSCGCLQTENRYGAKRETEYRVDGDVAYITTYDGTEVIINTCDLSTVLSHRWHMNLGYATDGKGIPMHRMLMQPPKEMDIHHINENKLDNRRSNLLMMTRAEHTSLHQRNKNANGVTVQEWIPVSETPKEDGSYLVTINHFGKFRGINIRSFAKDGEAVDEYDLIGKKDVWYFYDSEYGYVSTDSVTHWMPLPTPPKGE